jgi:hypothetical protein
MLYDRVTVIMVSEEQIIYIFRYKNRTQFLHLLTWTQRQLVPPWKSPSRPSRLQGIITQKNINLYRHENLSSYIERTRLSLKSSQSFTLPRNSLLPSNSEMATVLQWYPVLSQQNSIPSKFISLRPVLILYSCMIFWRHNLQQQILSLTDNILKFVKK